MARLTSAGQARTADGHARFVRTDTDTPKGVCPSVRAQGPSAANPKPKAAQSPPAAALTQAFSQPERTDR